MSKRRVAAYIAAALVAGLALGSIGIASAAQKAADNAQGRLGIRLGASIREAGATLADIVAELTGSTAEDVREERLEGKSFAEIAAEQDVAVEDVVAAAIGARKALLDEAVASGEITQAQADAALDRMQTRLTERVSSDTPCAGGGSGACAGSGAGGVCGANGASGMGRGCGAGRGSGAGSCGGCTAPATGQ